MAPPSQQKKSSYLGVSDPNVQAVSIPQCLFHNFPKYVTSPPWACFSEGILWWPWMQTQRARRGICMSRGKNCCDTILGLTRGWFPIQGSGPEKGVITKGVFSLEESLKSLDSLEILENGRNVLCFPQSGGSLEYLESLNSLENGLFWKDPFSKRPLFPNPKGGFGRCSPGTKAGTRAHSDVPPERNPEWGYVRMFPRKEKRNEGTFAKTTLLQNPPFYLPVNSACHSSAAQLPSQQGLFKGENPQPPPPPNETNSKQFAQTVCPNSFCVPLV